MVMTRFLAAASLLAAVALGASATTGASGSVPTISTVGSKFFDSNGDQFYVKGLSSHLSLSLPLHI